MERGELPEDQCVFLGVTGGYCYLNASALRMLGHRAPGMTAADIDASFFGDAPGVPEFVVKPGFDRPDLTEKIGATFNWVLTTPDLPDVKRHEEVMNELRRTRPDLAAMSDRELVESTLAIADEHFEMLFTEHIFISFLATVPIGIISKVCAAVGRETDTLKLLAGLGDVESAAPAMAMWDLGRIAAASPDLVALFDAGYAGLYDRLVASDSPDAAAFLDAFADFTFHYGCRGPNEWETRSPTWETEPDLALAAIDRMRLSDESAAPRVHNADRASERETIGAEIAAMLEGDPETQGQFVRGAPCGDGVHARSGAHEDEQHQARPGAACAPGRVRSAPGGRRHVQPDQRLRTAHRARNCSRRSTIRAGSRRSWTSERRCSTTAESRG